LSIGPCSGNAGDQLQYHNGAPFSTYDLDNDSYSGNCAKSYQGAWWYKKCHASNLNGRNFGDLKTPYAQGIVWKSITTHYKSLKFVKMMVKPAA